MKALILPFYVFLVCLLNVSSAMAQGNTYPEVRLFIDADKALVEKAGGSQKAQQFINELIAKVDAIYRSQLGLTVTLAGSHLWSTEDPFIRSGLSSSLASFADYAENTYRSTYSYDVAHLLLGSGLGGEGGIAYQGTACGTPFTASQAYGVSQPDINDLYEINAHLLAHELGHNLNSEHDEFPGCAVKTVMCPGQIGGKFSEQSKASISAYVTDRISNACFPSVARLDPVSAINLKITISDSKVSYKVTGAQACSSLSLVASPSALGLETTFAYLQLGKLTPASSINAYSKNALKLIKRGEKHLYVGVYCDGQLAQRKAVLNASKIKSKRATNSVILALRSLQKGFKAVK